MLLFVRRPNFRAGVCAALEFVRDLNFEVGLCDAPRKYFLISIDI